MGDNSKIEWTDATWNTVYGCTRASEGCDHCYAVKVTQRLAGKIPEARGLVNAGKRHFNGAVNFMESRLKIPLQWKRPRRIFVNSLSDLFHSAVPFSFIDRVFAVMALSPQHTFQVLTKRPERMREYFAEKVLRVPEISLWGAGRLLGIEAKGQAPWPLRNVHLGTSVENQGTANERIPHLLQTPAALRWLSMEPLLAHVDLKLWNTNALGWVVVGGESGPNGRPFNVEWARSIVAQCEAGGVPVFVKQLGVNPYEERPAEGVPQGTDEALKRLGEPHPQRPWFGPDWCLTHTPDGVSAWINSYRLKSKKGADPSEWPEDLRVQEFPTTEAP